ncbi:MAG: hypothetical protein Q8P46_13150 [Hyphomicrobiales bacterium]|nr:hypothetical protein [Hyphomicrobiales bacterium]
MTHGLPVRNAVPFTLTILLLPPIAGGEEARQSVANAPLDGMASAEARPEDRGS